MQDGLHFILETQSDVQHFARVLELQPHWYDNLNISGFGYVHVQDEASGVPTAGVYESKALLTGKPEVVAEKLRKLVPISESDNCLWQTPFNNLYRDNVKHKYVDQLVIEAQIGVVKVVAGINAGRSEGTITTTGPEPVDPGSHASVVE